MKTKTLIRLFFSLVVAFSFSACDDDAEIILFSGSQLIDEVGTCTNTVSSLNLYLNGDESADIGIANGKGGYSAQSSDESVVTATVSNDRLLLNSHGKKGKVTVTVSDKKGNSVVLPVTVAYGVMEFLCRGGYGGGFAVSVDGKILKAGDDANMELLKSVNEAMRPYAFSEGKETCILRPNNINKILGEGEGTFVFKSDNGDILAEGTYNSGYDDELTTGKQEIFLDFSYRDSEEIVKHHKFYYEPKLISSSSTRSAGPLIFRWVEDVTNSSYLEKVALPVNGKVLYVVSTITSRIMRPE